MQSAVLPVPTWVSREQAGTVITSEISRVAPWLIFSEGSTKDANPCLRLRKLDRDVHSCCNV